jgi:transposase-like protein
MDQLPETLLEVVRFFADEEVARQFFVRQRWPNGVGCPRRDCGSMAVQYISTRKLWRCKDCKRQFTAKVGTIFEDSPIGFSKWLPAMWLIANAKNGISSLEIHRALKVSKKTAWFMLHRIRFAMDTPTAIRLTGPVEADETYIGGKARGTERTGSGRIKSPGPRANRTIVMGIRERKGDMRAWVVPDTQARTVQGMVRDHVESGATVYTDALPSYIGLRRDYVHHIINPEQLRKADVAVLGTVLAERRFPVPEGLYKSL